MCPDIDHWTAYRDRMWSINDLFMIGVAFDLVGAILLGIGLVASPTHIARRNIEKWVGDSHVNPVVVVSNVTDRINAKLGFTILCAGFTIQLVTYAWLTLANVPSYHSTSRVISGLGVTAIVGACLWGTATVARSRMIHREIVDVAYEIQRDSAQDSAGVRADPGIAFLREATNELRLTPQGDEDFEPHRFLIRVFPSAEIDVYNGIHLAGRGLPPEPRLGTDREA